MNYKELSDKIRKFKKRELSNEEQDQLFHWLRDDKNEKAFKEFLLIDLKDSKPEESDDEKPRYEKIYENIKLSIREKEQNEQLVPFKKRSLNYYLRVAASIVLIFTSGGILSYYLFNNRTSKKIITYNEIVAPLGSKSRISLPDGSKVWLNAGSKILYFNNFNTENRYVFLEGEAYFNVAKNNKLPFKVKTEELNIVAEGTEFNVKAYKEEGIIETTLIEGKVSISNIHRSNKKSGLIYLKPHQKAVYVKEYQQLKIEDLKTIKKSNPEVLKPQKGIVYITAITDPEPIVSWTDNRLIIKSEEMGNLAIKLERKYNIKISFESENIKQYKFSGTLEDETLTQVLDVIKLNAPIDYILHGKEVKIVENKHMAEKFSIHLKKK